jgi:hypothetical protein
MFMDVRGCSLRVVGVPVKLHRMTWRENLNLRRRSFSSVGKRIDGLVKRMYCEICPFLSNGVEESQTVLLPVLKRHAL